MDPSLKPDASRKGSYYRRIEDVSRALERLSASQLVPEMQFVSYYFGCEKIARGIVGIHQRIPATKAYHHRGRLSLGEIKVAALQLGLGISPDRLEWIFADHQEQRLLQSVSPAVCNSARVLRNNLTHDFGPTNVAIITRHASFLNPVLLGFLGCTDQVLSYLRAHFSGVP